MRFQCTHLERSRIRGEGPDPTTDVTVLLNLNLFERLFEFDLNSSELMPLRFTP